MNATPRNFDSPQSISSQSISYQSISYRLASLRISFVSLIVLICLLSWPSQSWSQPAFPNNSMDKIRVTPGTQANRIGSAVQWEPSFEAALEKSAETGKPIFWYVPTLRGSFMDRKTEIDRYMLAGPFSWPEIIDVLNEHFVPVNSKPNRQQQKQFDLVPYVFIEPGFVVVDPAGEVKMKLDRITTLHPKWFGNLLSRNLAQAVGATDKPVGATDKPVALNEMWDLFEEGRYQEIKLPEIADNAPDATEQLLLAGMVEFRRGDHVAAQANWQRASKAQPDHPLAWKAAAEAQGFGPFVRGFEVHRSLPEKAMNAGVDSAGSAAPVDAYTEAELWQRGLDFLLAMQNQDGGFTDSDYDFGGTDSLPNVHTAVTSIVGMALLEIESRLPADSPKKEAVGSAIQRAAKYVVDPNHINLEDKDELLWAFAYRVRFISRLTKRNPKYAETLQVLVKDLEAIQSGTGAWFHEYANSFVTATALTALSEAKNSGGTVSQSVVDKGLDSLSRDRYGNGAFPYSTNRQGVKKEGSDRHVAAAAGRMPLCEVGLSVWNRSSDKDLISAVARSFELNENLMVALKYDDHTSRLAYGGFFFWYDVRGRSEAILNIKDDASRKSFQKSQRSLILSLPELDGCFVDSHEIGRVYGTAMALLSLAACDD